MKRLLLLALCVGITTSCKKDSYPEEEKNYCKLHFTLQLVPEVIPFPSTKSIPDYFPPEPGSNTTKKEEIHSFLFLEYAVYSSDGEFIKHNQFTTENDPGGDFGDYHYDFLPDGNYRICFLTHSFSPGDLQADTLFTFNTVSDSFYGIAEVEITPDMTEEYIPVNLCRMVSRIEFVAKDTVPSIVNSFHMTISQLWHTFNMRDGTCGFQRKDTTFIHTFKEEERGKEIHPTHAFYTFVPSGDKNLIPRVQLLATGQENDTIKFREVKEIPVIQNRITRYTGILYTTNDLDNTFELTFDNDGKWDDPIENEL